MAALVGEQIAYYRTRQAVFTAPDLEQRVIPPLTLQELSDRCTELGYPIARSVLSKLEKGHRQTITVDEVQVLAAALHVPPVLLLFPLARSQAVEVLPGLEVHPWDAIRWYTGELPMRPGAPDYAGRDGPITLFGLHHHLVLDWPREQERLAAAIRDLRAAKTPEEQREAQDEVEYRREAAEGISLRAIRTTMRTLGFLPPELPADIARAIGEEAPDGSR